MLARRALLCVSSIWRLRDQIEVHACPIAIQPKTWGGGESLEYGERLIQYSLGKEVKQALQTSGVKSGMY